MILEIIIFLVFGIGVGTFGTLVGIGGADLHPLHE